MSHRRHAHGPLVRALREAHKLTLGELGQVANLSPSYLSRVEREQDKAASERATSALATALGVFPQELTGQWPPYRALRVAICPSVAIEDFAESVVMSVEELTDIERGRIEPAPDVVARIALRLGVDVALLEPQRYATGPSTTRHR